MKKQLVFLGLGLLLITFSCKKEKDEPTPDGKITFWISRDNGCGSVDVSIDGTSVGKISNWQTTAPASCVSSNILLTVTTKQGTKSVTFKNSCRTWTESINLNSDCFVYKLF